MFEGFSLHTSRREIVFFYVVSLLAIAFGLYVVVRELGNDNTAKATWGTAIALCGAAFALIVRFRRRIPNRVKFYTCGLVFITACVFIIVHPEGTGRFNHPTINRIVGIVGAAFLGCGLTFVAYKDIKWHIEHKNERH